MEASMSYAEYANLPDVKFTYDAIKICTLAQLKAINSQLGDPGIRKLSVFVDFSLPRGYLYCVRHTYYPHSEIRIGTIHMGIDPEGRIST